MLGKKRVNNEGKYLGKKKIDSQHHAKWSGPNYRQVGYLGEQGVKAVDFLAFLHKGIVLGDTAESELVHQVDLVGLDHVLILEGLDDEGEGCRVKHDLTLLGEVCEQLLDNGREFGTEELIGLIHDKGRTFAKVGDALSSQVEDTTGGTDNNVNSFGQSHNIILEGGASCRDHDLHTHVLAQGLADLSGLESQLSGRDQEQGLNLCLFQIDLFQGGDNEGSRLSCAVLGSGQDVPACEGNRYRLFLDGRWSFEASLEDAHQELALQEVVLELVALGRSDVLCGSKGEIRKSFILSVSRLRNKQEQSKTHTHSLSV